MYSYDDLFKISIDDLKFRMCECDLNIKGTKTREDLIRRVINNDSDMKRYIDSFNNFLYNWTLPRLKQLMKDNEINGLTGNKRELIKRIMDSGIQF